ncbi:hypothetical protein EMIHUDRAFT_197776 [Emiliania huxleyi CCMP1516]|uniref:Uncharacterized protein n=2 Tax=Emiliania huxleyi TaxID=2903 RepID=A0A0D3IDQ8_EMIH1|nr:hypothetical protein EMIHUDRAFT_197776 [Emiliania huxleyi CCMP1516]EOD09393.1 hypothetical protein EMIHUDRAFT_197776 [Emiliania huxleyi CCMP1516]|eukprot:XP_005761822.1 hypothetical protein EMIHUDRAFT_197776 [Emiliania huxleyi CCMP1516]
MLEPWDRAHRAVALWGQSPWAEPLEPLPRQTEGTSISYFWFSSTSTRAVSWESTVSFSYVRAAVSATVSAIWALSLRRWGLLSLGSSLLYLWNISTLSSRRRNSPCPEHGPLLRIMYGLFSTWLAERVLGHLLVLHTRPDEPQAEQIGGTLPSVMGPRELRIKVVPILGAQVFSGHGYADMLLTNGRAQRPVQMRPSSQPTVHCLLKNHSDESATHAGWS